MLPCYVVCDISLSMTDHIDKLNAGLREFRGAVHSDPVVAAMVRCCVVGFADTPRVLQPLCHVADLVDLAGLAADSSTKFGPMFAFLREAIHRDVLALKAARLRVHRPIVFVLSDGQATDPVTWPAEFAALTDPAWHARPNMIAFGVGDADPHTLGQIGTLRTFLERDGVRMSTALTASVMWTPAKLDHV